mmetsp:Transcript_53874/g.153490  ORF Transcript_53874/g.153490 Transcript_53874/m.153490 type:complete len:1040 (+) Transcript_53874:3-3122(+)
MEYRSASAALLMALLPYSAEQPAQKSGLEEAARRYSDATFRPTRENMHAGWERVHELVRRGLVERRKNSGQYVVSGVGAKDSFWLAELGRTWALKAKATHEQRSGQRIEHVAAAAAAAVASAGAASHGRGRARGRGRGRGGANAAPHQPGVATGAVTGLMDKVHDDGTLKIHAKCASESSDWVEYDVMVHCCTATLDILSSCCTCKFAKSIINASRHCKHANRVLEVYRNQDETFARDTTSSISAAGIASGHGHSGSSSRNVSGLLGGSAVQAAPPRPLPQSEEAMAVLLTKDLKACLQANGIDVRGCIERQDLTDKARARFPAMPVHPCRDTAQAAERRMPAGGACHGDLSPAARRERAAQAALRRVAQTDDVVRTAAKEEQGEGARSISTETDASGTPVVSTQDPGSSGRAAAAGSPLLAPGFSCCGDGHSQDSKHGSAAVLPGSTRDSQVFSRALRPATMMDLEESGSQQADMPEVRSPPVPPLVVDVEESQEADAPTGCCSDVEQVLVEPRETKNSVPLVEDILPLDADGRTTPGDHALRDKMAGRRIAMFVDERERGRNTAYIGIIHALEQQQQQQQRGPVVQAKLQMGDYLWVELGDPDDPHAAPLLEVAVERKTVGDLVQRSGRGDQLLQTFRLRRVGFGSTVVLLEGDQWKARETGLHVDRFTDLAQERGINSEDDLFRYIVRELLAGTWFLETPNNGRTATVLAAITDVLAAGPPSDTQGTQQPGLPWHAALKGKKSEDALVQQLFPGAGAAAPQGARSNGSRGAVQLELRTLQALESELRLQLEQVLAGAEVRPADVPFAHCSELQDAVQTCCAEFGGSPALFAARFGMRLAVAKSLLDLFGPATEPNAKRQRSQGDGTLGLGDLMADGAAEVIEDLGPGPRNMSFKVQAAGCDPAFRIMVHQCQGEDFLLALAAEPAEVGGGADPLAAVARADRAVGRLLQCFPRRRGVHAAWDMNILLLEHLNLVKLGDVGVRLGADPAAYVALVQVLLVVRHRVAVKVARTERDGAAFIRQLGVELRTRSRAQGRK